VKSTPLDRARAEVNEAASAWRTHRKICSRCSKFTGRQDSPAPCPDGALKFMRSANAWTALAQAKRDANPPGLTLFLLHRSTCSMQRLARVGTGQAPACPSICPEQA
jgi:hypothetical protein